MVNFPPSGMRGSFDGSEVELSEFAKKKKAAIDKTSSQDKNIEIESLDINKIAEALDVFLPLMADGNIEDLFIIASKDQKDKTEIFYNFKTREARPVVGKKLAQKLAEDPSFTFKVQDRNKTTSTPESLGALVTEKEASELWQNYEFVLIQQAAKSRQGAEDTLKEAKKQEQILEADMKRDQQNIEKAQRKNSEKNEDRRDAHLKDAKLLNEINKKNSPLKAEDGNIDQKTFIREQSANKKLRKKQQDASEQIAKDVLKNVRDDEIQKQ